MARSWTKDEALAELNALTKQTRAFEKSCSTDAFTQWRHRVLACLRQVVAPESHYLTDFGQIPWQPVATGTAGAELLRPGVQTGTQTRIRATLASAFGKHLARARGVLEAVALEVDRLGVATLDAEGDLGLEGVHAILHRFHRVAVELRHRREDRPTLDVSDEYDVQDLLGALLFVACADVRREEWTPSYAAKSTRADFLLPLEQAFIEVKKMRPGFTEKKLGEELIVDVAHYRKHSGCKRLICFVYDPETRIRNPVGLMRDLAVSEKDFAVEVIIVPSR